MKSIILSVICFLMFNAGGYAMIETLSLTELAGASDLIVTGTAVAIKVVETKPEGYTVIANLFQVQECLKGQTEAGVQIKIKTLGGLMDSTQFVEGEKFLLFLKKVENHYEIVNEPQGAWPVEANGSFSGMGSDTTLEQVKTAIK